MTLGAGPAERESRPARTYTREKSMLKATLTKLPDDPVNCSLEELTGPVSGSLHSRTLYTLAGEVVSPEKHRAMDENIRNIAIRKKAKRARGL